MDNDFEPDSYRGLCGICGLSQVFVRTKRSILETYCCADCKALLRDRRKAEAVIDCYSTLRARTLSELTEKFEFRRLAIYEPGAIGPTRRLFRGLPHYQQSACYPEAQRSEALRGLPHQNIEELTFCNASFDLVITSDILEHVRMPECAFGEIVIGVTT